MLLWIEDIHWADRSTRSLPALPRRQPQRRARLVVATYRSDELHRRHPLRPLLAELERSRAPGGSSSSASTAPSSPTSSPTSSARPRTPTWSSACYGRSEGNPLFTEELLAAGVDGRGAAAAEPARGAAAAGRAAARPRRQRLLRLLAVAGRAGARPARRRRRASSRPSSRRRCARRSRRRSWSPTTRGASASATPCCARCSTTTCCPGERVRAPPAARRGARAHARRGATGPGSATGIAHHYYAAGDQPRALKAAVEAAGGRPPAARLRRGRGAARPRAGALEPRSRTPRSSPGIDHAELLARAGARALPLRATTRSARPCTSGRSRRSTRTPSRERAATAAHRARDLPVVARARRAQPRDPAPRRSTCSPATPTRRRARELLAQRVRFLLLQGRFREVREEAPEALEAADALGLEHARAGVVNRLGCALFALGRRGGGARAARASRSSSPSATGITDDLATAYLNYADALHMAGRSRGGAETSPSRGSREVQELARRPASTRSMRWIRLNIAEIEFDLGDWGAARPSSTPPAGRSSGVALARTPSFAARSLRSARADAEDAREELDARRRPAARRPRAAVHRAARRPARPSSSAAAGDLDAARAAVDARHRPDPVLQRGRGHGMALVAAAGARGRGRRRRAGLRPRRRRGCEAAAVRAPSAC